MSWKDYVDKQLIASGFISQAAIISKNGSSVWAKTPSFNLSAAELQLFSVEYAKKDFFQTNGITLGGTKYIFLSGNDRVLRAKKNKAGLHCMMTEQAIIVCTYEEPTTPQQAANVVEKLGEYLISCSY